MQPLSQNFTVPVVADSLPVVTLSTEASINSLASTACQEASRTFVSETPVSLSVDVAAATTGGQG